MFLSFCSFHLVYQLKAHIKLNSWNSLDEMEQRNSEKNQKKFLVLNDKWRFCLLTFNSRADIITSYNFNQVRCFFTLNRFNGLMDTPVKYMNNKFQILTNIYVCIWYFIGFTFLENVVLLVKYLPVIW